MQHRRHSFLSQNHLTSLFPGLLLACSITIVISLTGCASTQETTVPFTPIAVEPSKTLIYLYRESRFVGAINKAEIFINGEYAGQLVNGSYCTYVGDGGPIEIKALEKIPAILVLRSLLSKLAGKQPIFEFTAEPDQDYFLEFNVAGYKVKQVSKAEALAKMGGLAPAKLSIDPSKAEQSSEEKSPE